MVPLKGQVPAGLGVNFLTGRVYAALNDNEIAVLLEKNNTVSYATYGSMTTGVAVDPLLGREYVTDGTFVSPTVGVLNGAGGTVTAVPTGLFPQGVDADFFTSNIFVANEADGTITEIYGYDNKNTVVATIPIAANSVAVNPRQGTVYAAGSTSVTVFTED
jgi:DNA-binding beta-propeller fold protein YncE